MLSFLSRLFTADTQRRSESAKVGQGRKLEMDEPMAAAGAQLAGEKSKGETETTLKDGH